MIEYNTEQMTEKELIDAANKIFSIEKQDFEKIKSEKWYQTLFHAITLNQDGKKIAVKGIHSLAKLQQLFMMIYVKNYKKSHDQLNEIIDAAIKNSEAIKRLYGACVLNLEEQMSLSSLDAYDAEILALFLGEYRNSEGVVPDEVKKYNRGVLTALNQNVPKGVLDNHQIRKLKNPKVVYRCFMEQSAVDGTIDSQEWTDKIYEDLKDFELSDNSKREIKESVKYEAEIAGVEYFIVKYTKDNAGVLDTDFEIDIEGFADENIDQYYSKYEKEKKYILVETPAGKLCRIVNEEIYWINIMDYLYDAVNEGAILFEFYQCQIYYNFTPYSIKLTGRDRVIFDKCEMICGQDSQDKYMLICKDNAKVIIKNSILEKPERTINSLDGNVKVEIENTEIRYPCAHFIDLYQKTSELVIKNCMSLFESERPEGIFHVGRCTVQNSSFLGKKEKKEKCDIDNMWFLVDEGMVRNSKFENLQTGMIVHGKIQNCSFYNCENVVLNCEELDSCYFENCSNPQSNRFYIGKIANCVFNKAINLFCSRMKNICIENSYFVNIRGIVIQELHGGKIESCIFKNIIVGEKEYNGNMCSAITLYEEKTQFTKCVFENIVINDQFFIECRGHDSRIILGLKDCAASNCTTYRNDGVFILTEVNEAVGKPFHGTLWDRIKRDTSFIVYETTGNKFNVSEIENFKKENCKKNKGAQCTIAVEEMNKYVRQILCEKKIGVIEVA